MYVWFRTVASAALLLAFVLSAPLAGAQPVALEHAHAHNDYEHARPLFDALSYGFNSVEADIYLVDGELLVAHDLEDVQPDRTLERLYLAPLRDLAWQNEGQVHSGMRPLLLLIDIKSDGEATYARLHSLLRKYADIVTIYAGDTTVEGAITVVVSGERPRATMLEAPVRFAAFDGRPADLDSGESLSSSFMPLVSESWSRISEWSGEGPAPAELRIELRHLTEVAHAQGRRLRLWGTPEREAVWSVLREAGVDLINTDELARLRAFLLAGE